MLEGFVPFPPEFAARYRARGYWQDRSLAQEFADVFQRYADRVAVWSQGKILASGPPATILSDPAVLREVIGVETKHAHA